MGRKIAEAQQRVGELLICRGRANIILSDSKNAGILIGTWVSLMPEHQRLFEEAQDKTCRPAGWFAGRRPSTSFPTGC